MTTTATTATTEPARPKLVLKKRVVVDVAALKASQPTAQPKPTSQPQPAVKPASQQQEKPLTRKERHALKMKEQAEAAEKKRAAKAAEEAAKKAEEAAKRAANRVANEEAEKRATAHREAFEAMFKRLTMVGCKKPLAVNSDEILLEYARRKIPDITMTTVRGVIGKHCRHANYLTMLSISAGKPRYHPMSGEIMGEVTEEQARTAGERLESRRAARRAAKEAARQGGSVPTNAVQTGTEST